MTPEQAALVQRLRWDDVPVEACREAADMIEEIAGADIIVCDHCDTANAELRHIVGGVMCRDCWNLLPPFPFEKLPKVTP